jgi:hypothetical protein
LKEDVFAALQLLAEPDWMNPTVMSLYVKTLVVGAAGVSEAPRVAAGAVVVVNEHAARAAATTTERAIRNDRDFVI